jgi:hypothetical protein
MRIKFTNIGSDASDIGVPSVGVPDVSVPPLGGIPAVGVPAVAPRRSPLSGEGQRNNRGKLPSQQIVKLENGRFRHE